VTNSTSTCTGVLLAARQRQIPTSAWRLTWTPPAGELLCASCSIVSPLPDYYSENADTVEYLRFVARAEGLDLQVRLGNPTYLIKVRLPELYRTPIDFPSRLWYPYAHRALILASLQGE
jgi:hypothetical protein